MLKMKQSQVLFSMIDGVSSVAVRSVFVGGFSIYPSSGAITA